MRIKASGDESNSIEAWARFTDCSEARHLVPRKRRDGSFLSTICLGGTAGRYSTITLEKTIENSTTT